MQLKRKAGVGERLAMATCLLLAVPAARADANAATDVSASVATDGDRADLGGLFYKEDAGRVQVLEGVVSVRTVTDDNSSLNLNLTLDTLSGGSPNGALPSHSTQTFATPSGHSLQAPAAPSAQTCTTPSGIVYACGSSPGSPGSIYTVAPGELPLDKTFHDQREAASLSYTTPATATRHVTVGAAYSHEVDFQSLSANGLAAQDFNQKNTTLALGLNLEYDSNNPIGGTPVPLSDYSLFQRGRNRSKAEDDVLLGLTQVMTRRWLMQLNLSAGVSHGYQNDPYKIVSGLDSNGNVVGYIYENRPDYRYRRGIFWENRFALDRDTLDVSYRLMHDDWGVVSHTAEIDYRYELGDGTFLEPDLRWYRQTSASFYRLYVLQGAPFLATVSADPRLGEFTATSVGLKYGYAFDADSEISLRLLRYQQHTVVSMPVLPALRGLDLYPGLGATVVEADLQFRF